MKKISHPLRSYNYLRIGEDILVSIRCLSFDLCKENKRVQRNSWNTCFLPRV